MSNYKKWWGVIVYMAVLAPVFLLFFITGALGEIKKPPNYPNRPLKFVVTWGPGGGSDTFARVACKEAEKILGVPIGVVNIPGGAGIAGMTHVMSEPADGYSLFGLGVDQLWGWVIKHHPYTIDDWAVVCRGCYDVSMMSVCGKEKRFTTWPELVDYSKAHPEYEFTLSTPGLMSTVALWMTLMGEGTGLNFELIPYDSFAERAASVVGGHVDLLWETPGNARSFVEAGDLKPLLVFADHRVKNDPLYRDVPCQKEFGVKFIDDPCGAWRGISAKKGTPQEIVEYLDQVFHKAMQSKAYKELERTRHWDIRKGYAGHEEFRKFCQHEYDVFHREAVRLGWVE